MKNECLMHVLCGVFDLYFVHLILCVCVYDLNCSRGQIREWLVNA